MTRKLSDPEFKTKVVENMENIPDDLINAMMSQAIREAENLLKSGSIDVKSIAKHIHRAFVTGTATGMALKDDEAVKH